MSDKTTDQPEPRKLWAKALPDHLRWKGEGPPPPYWYAPDGTKVYRSYEDYCDD